MQTYDVKRDRRFLYAPTADDFSMVDVPEIGFLMVDGHGDPNAAPAYREAVEALYGCSYAVRALAKAELGRAHIVAPWKGCGPPRIWGCFSHVTRVRGTGR